MILGSTETALADPNAIRPLGILDLAGPSAEATVLSSIKSGGQGRISYLLTDDPHPHAGVTGDVSLEQPTPEIQNVMGTTTDAVLAHYPDMIGTVEFGDGDNYNLPAGTVYEEYWHIQFGSVVRDLSLVSSDNSLHESAFGWGLQLSGLARIGRCMETNPNAADGIGFSATCGAGIGHYINDLHLAADLQKTGGNDAFFNPTTKALDSLPAQACFICYLHHWSDCWQSTCGYSHVELDRVGAESTGVNLTPTALTMYRSSNYAIANLVYHTTLQLPKPAAVTEKDGTEATAAPTATPNDLYSGLEFLYGEKRELSGNRGQDNRLEFVVSVSK